MIKRIVSGHKTFILCRIDVHVTSLMPLSRHVVVSTLSATFYKYHDIVSTLKRHCIIVMCLLGTFSRFKRSAKIKDRVKDFTISGLKVSKKEGSFGSR